MTALTLEEAVTVLEGRNIPTESVIRGAQYINDNMPSVDEAKRLIFDWTGEQVGEGNKPQRLLLVYGYLVQNILRAHLMNQAADLVDLLARSKEQADKLLEEQAWMFIADEDARADIENADPEVVKAGKAKKGARKVLALRIFNEKIKDQEMSRKEAIAILMEDVGLSAAGASTYYANFKSGKWA
jgi:hypothetical protein